MLDKIAIGLIATLMVVGTSFIIYSAKVEQEFITKCEAKNGIPKLGKGIMVCLKHDSMIEIN